MTELALEITGLEVAYGPIKAVRGVSLAVPNGEFRAVIGANGAGKSSMLRAIFGLQRLAAGSIRVFGRDVTSMRPDQIMRLGIAWVPEGRQVWSELTVVENLQMACFGLSRRESAQRIDHQLERFPRLRERRSQLAGSLSGGEQQMVAIARALATHPRLLLLDEPSLGLAPLIIREVFDLLERIHAEGITVLLVEQNAEQALRRSDWTYVMERGEVVREGPSADLRNTDDVKQIYLGG